ncbi:hypothetical protein [Paraburkholderia gardini]|jgi:hypothetical protein|uniref:Uncharacterized protein n=1 Tax=Paraburkholderia gardini TaxID=2823469 RepID=A0ABN7QFJ0_9BURK|nr:hypothetical protein R69919_00088 [Paraburkholderia gardini]CAG4891364.1 hypothetical protein R54767_01111 [Paraburkholderia gardini]
MHVLTQSRTACRARAGWLSLAILVVCLLAGMPGHTLFAQGTDNAATLRNRFQSLTQQLEHNPFHRQLYMDSSESPTNLKGDIYAVVDYPFATVNGALNDPANGPANWCDVLILHLNVKYCHAATHNGTAQLSVNLGKKVEEKLSSTYRVQFNYRSAVTSADYFRVELNADTGPLSTKNYRIVLEAIPLSGNRTFLHLTYAYGYGVAGRLAMKTYLSTIGSDKVGFTTVNDASSGQPEYIGGVRGLLERNTMRYYLAIDAYLGALQAPAGARLQQRLTTWFDATEQYPRQLHEVDRDDYLQMKNNEYQRQQTAQ